MNEKLKSRLVQMVEDESRLKTELASDGSLYEGYPNRIRELHLNQANELERIMETTSTGTNRVNSAHGTLKIQKM